MLLLIIKFPALCTTHSVSRYRFGKTKVFLRSGVIATLEKMRGDWLDKCATAIQKVWRARASRRAFLRIKRAALVVKRCVADYSRLLIMSYLFLFTSVSLLFSLFLYLHLYLSLRQVGIASS